MATQAGGLARPFAALIAEACRRHAGLIRGWRVDANTDPAQMWVHVRPERGAPPAQGWKLHISAGPASAEAVLLRALPILLTESAPFKVAGSLDVLARLNDGRAGLSQVGKFITVYPGDDHTAVRLAVRLDEATHGLRGPAIPSDRALAPDSLVSYRYGGSAALHLRTLLGEILPAIRAPDGTIVPDRRRTYYSPPPWVHDPFLAAGVVEEPPASGPLIGGRYLIIAPRRGSARGTISLAVDAVACRRCILKQARRDATLDSAEYDARDRLRHEAEVLRRLGADPRFPAVFGVSEHGGDLYLAMEEVDGERLDTHIAGWNLRGCLDRGRRLVAWGEELAATLALIHDHGLVYRDLNSANVIIAADGRLRLIDFEFACDQDAEAPLFGGGSFGYRSPQLAAGGRPAVTDDVYSLGALLYCAATGAEPVFAPHPFSLLDRPIGLLNPTIGPALAGVIERCLDTEPGRRFPSMAALATALATVGDGASVAPPRFGGEPALEPEDVARRRCRALARRLGRTLASAARPAPDGDLAWVSTHPAGAGLLSHDINTGSGGALLALAELAAEFPNRQHREVVSDAARRLATAPAVDPPLPGLYVGEAGVGAALLRAGQVLGDHSLIAAAAARGRWIGSQPYASPDLFNGTAGRLRFHLLLWDETADPVHLACALAAGEALLDAAEQPTSGECRWTIPPGYEGLSSNAYLGYAHGAAGIADALLDLHDATGQPRFLDAATGTARWLARLAVPVPDDASGWGWPEVEGAAPVGPAWCHGAAGIGRFFLHAARLGAAPGAAELAAGAARAAARGGRWLGPTQCHGLPGNIEFLLDMYQETGDDDYLREARSLARLLGAFATEEDGVLAWPSDVPDIISPDYMVGYAGVAMCLLRLADPERRPLQLSRRGFRFRTATAAGHAPVRA